MKILIPRINAISIGILLLASSLATADDKNIIRIATMPAGAEVTGLSTNAIGELFLNAQHPGGKNTFKDDAPPALIGYVHGFDSTGFDGKGLELPSDGERNKVNTVGGKYVIFGRAGDSLNSSQLLGGVYDTSGKLMYVSNSPDYNGFIPTGANTAYLYTGWEGAGRDGASAISKIALRRSFGQWEADLSTSRMLDLSSVYGGSVLCSGIVTPWGTPLLSEEYFFYETSVWNHPDNHDEDERASYQKGNDITYIKPKNMNQYLGKMSNPYRYGYMIEINNAATSDSEELVKHYVTGRLSHETATIMPDMKTVYMTDDDSAVYKHKKYNTASGGVFFKFVADFKGDLSQGTLYAAKLVQDELSDPQKAGFNVTWITLAHSNNTLVEGWISEYDNVTVEDYTEGESNYISTREIQAWAENRSGVDSNNDGTIGQSSDDRAAFLESRRAAAALGATNEWDKMEGVTSFENTVYLAVSSLSATMDKSFGHMHWATGEKDDSNSGAIALDKESCGGVYIAQTGNDYNITRLEPHLIGKSTEDGCDVELPANPDNILAMNDGSLMIGEDAGKKKHPVDMLWLVRR